MDIEKILDEYRNGDEGKRLCLFLAFRDLRDHFCCIEQACPPEDFTIVNLPWCKRHRIERAA